LKTVFRIAIALMILAAVDPMEGSIIIALTSIVLGFTAFKLNDRHRYAFAIISAFICFGVTCLWWVSSLGGFVPSKEWWWIVALVPYPLGWLCFVVLMLYRWIRSIKKGNKEIQKEG
jgi:hypothetical protein